MGRPLLLLRLVLSGSAVTLASQQLIDAEFVHPNVQAVALLRYASVTFFAACRRSSSRGSHFAKLSRNGRLLLLFNGCLDCFAYGLNCVGFRLCGASLALTIFAATSQTLTALLSFCISSRRLSAPRLLALAVVNVGVYLRSIARSGQPAQLGWTSLSRDQVLGAAFILLASFCYSLLGVCYELFLSLEDPRLPYSEYMYQTSRIGLVAVLLYQVVFVLPHWSTLVAQPLAAKGQPVMYSAVLYLTGLLLFGALYIVHSYCSAHLFQRDGAVAVNLANACRGTVVTMAAGAWMCSERRPQHCLGRTAILSAGMVSAGACLWALAPAPPAPARARGASWVRTKRDAKKD